ncbi:hypothetical protein JB92DRAFT_3146185 [Gautieria morchelliformis]|nr:hypothetical protein JB92DRAFT_3146185 [Gautieria morchelliformis]
MSSATKFSSMGTSYAPSAPSFLGYLALFDSWPGVMSVWAFVKGIENDIHSIEAANYGLNSRLQFLRRRRSFTILVIREEFRQGVGGTSALQGQPFDQRTEDGICSYIFAMKVE